MANLYVRDPLVSGSTLLVKDPAQALASGFGVQSVSSGPYQPGTVVTFTTVNAAAAPVSVSTPAGAITIDSTNDLGGGSYETTITIPADWQSYGVAPNQLPLGSAVTFTLNDGVDDATQDLTIAAETGWNNNIIADSGYAGMLSGAMDIQDGVDYLYYQDDPTSDAVVDGTTGAVEQGSTGGSWTFYVFDVSAGAWVGPATYTIDAPGAAAPIVFINSNQVAA